MNTLIPVHINGDYQLDTSRENIERIEAELLRLPQAEASVTHRFGAGVYIRELHVPVKGEPLFAIGRHHRFEHWNIMLTGRVTVLKQDGSVAEFKAPCVFLGQPGKKIGVVHEEMRWLNIFATDETDVAKLEERLFEPCDTLYLEQTARTGGMATMRDGDRKDFLEAIAELGYTPEEVRAEVEIDDLVPLPAGSYGFVVAPSEIEGKGLFATTGFAPGQTIAPANLDGRRTIAGRFTNHSAKPNARFVLSERGIDLVAAAHISGSRGGLIGDEITVCYRAAHATKGKLCPVQLPS